MHSTAVFLTRLVASYLHSLLSVLNATEEDLQLLLSAQCHLGAKNATSVMTPYVYKRRNDGTQIIFSLVHEYECMLTSCALNC